ncbi:hypothetical protein EIP91_003388 [Steccherinum ochraceum]|uniref:Aminoglycoside phosphotransferase domain-containing protein n=1 Tax=Steccherinum ochraceum TaxID=92696 RepID=A0A4R0RGY1_9APHY|nr:hypothetical protein EIP91_003388 [Steccherinum ochraceum]
MARREDLQISLEQVQAIIDKHRPSDPPPKISVFHKITDESFSSLTTTQSYVARTTEGPTYVLKAAPPPSSDPPTYVPNTLALEHALVQKIVSLQGVPHPSPIAFDESGSIIPYHYLLSEHPAGISLAAVRTSKKLTDKQRLLLDLRIGSHFKRIHEEVQNDWFGLPSQEKDELYSWQEAFTYLLETVLHDVKELGEDLPYEEIRKCLSRAIGFFLFDDCEVPSLISFLGDEETITVAFDPSDPTENEEIPITSLFSLSHAVWGDPLLETAFVNPSQAFLEGYGGSPIIFNRQKTKRMWYTLFQALVVLVQSHRLQGAEAVAAKSQVEWARNTVAQCVKDLKDAPCY